MMVDDENVTFEFDLESMQGWDKSDPSDKIYLKREKAMWQNAVRNLIDTGHIKMYNEFKNIDQTQFAKDTQNLYFQNYILIKIR